MSKDRGAVLAPLPTPTVTDPRKRAVEPVSADRYLRTHVSYPKVYMVAVGRLVEGFKFYGPFTTLRIAVDWAADNLKPNAMRCVYSMSHVRGVRGEVEATA